MFVVAQLDHARLAIRVRELRGAQTLSLVAERAGIRQDELGKIERGERTAIKFDTILRLCRALAVDVGELFTVVDDSPQEPLLSGVLANIAAGRLEPSAPRGRGAGRLAPALEQDLDEAERFMARAADPTAPGRRRRAPLA